MKNAKEILEDFKQLESVNEGMWSSPFTSENANKIAELLSKPITLADLDSEEGKQKYWNIIGDDQFWDAVADEAFDMPDTDARYLIVKFLEDWIENKESFNSNAYSDEAETIIKKAIFKFNGRSYFKEEISNEPKIGKDIDLYGNKLIPVDILPKLEKIAKDVLFIDTLKTRYSDDKDFHDVACWGVAEALYQAYLLGQQLNDN